MTDRWLQGLKGLRLRTLKPQVILSWSGLSLAMESGVISPCAFSDSPDICTVCSSVCYLSSLQNFLTGPFLTLQCGQITASWPVICDPNSSLRHRLILGNARPPVWVMVKQDFLHHLVTGRITVSLIPTNYICALFCGLLKTIELLTF